MIGFYWVDKDYAKYLQEYDSRIPNIQYGNTEKFLCGVVLTVNGYNYFAPISSKTYNHRTDFIIRRDDGSELSSVRLGYMFPVPDGLFTRIDFSKIRKSDAKYADLLAKEYAYCSSHESNISDMAKKAYRIGCNKNHFLNRSCCDFLVLEKACAEYADAMFRNMKNA